MNPNHPRILIVKLSAIGDVVHTLPALNALRAHYPHAHITWLVEEAAADLVKNHPAVDRVLVSRRKTWLKGLRGRDRGASLRQIAGFVRRLRDTSYDMVFDFQASLKGAALIAMTRGRRKIGFGRGMQHQELSYIFLNERIAPVSMEIHALKRGLTLLEAAGIPWERIDYGLPLTECHRLCADRLLSQNGVAPDRPFWVINPAAKWDTKLWDQRKVAELADQLVERFNRPVVFTGSTEDRPMIHAIIACMQSPAVNLSGRTDLLALAALLQRSAAMITTDTGPMHIAAAVGTPTVALFGPTAPWRTGPFGERHRVVRGGLDCSPCYKRSCANVSCMTAISVEQVLAALDGVLIHHRPGS